MKIPFSRSIIQNNFVCFTTSLSLKYHLDKTFRCNVNNYIKDNNLKLSIEFNANNYGTKYNYRYCYNNKFDINNLYLIDRLWLINVKNITNVHGIENLLELELVNCDHIKDMSILKKLQKLYFNTTKECSFNKMVFLNDTIYGLHLLKNLKFCTIRLSHVFNKIKLFKKQIAKLNKLKKNNVKLLIFNACY